MNCSQLVTLAGPTRPRVGAELSELAIIPDGAMIIAGERITSVGRYADIKLFMGSETEVVDAAGCVVTPGFVDAHTHPVFGGNRVDEFEMRSNGKSYEEIAQSGGGIQSTVAKTRAASEDELFASGKRYAEWFLRCGTTTIEAKSGYGLTPEDELKILRVIRKLDKQTPLNYVPTFLGAHAVPKEFESAESYIQCIIEQMLPAIASQKLAKHCDVFCESGYFTVAQSKHLLNRAQELGLKARIHADQLTRCGGAELAAEVGAATADHLEQTDSAGIQALKNANVQPVLLPGSVYALGKAKYPAAREMIEAGLAVVLATDFNPGSSPTPSIPMILSLACTHMKMSPAESLTAATINAAYSLGLGERIGSLQIGKDADFVVHDCKDYRELAYFFGLEHAVATYSKGALA